MLSIFKLLTLPLFLQVLVIDSVNPDDASHDDEGHRGKNHEAVVGITVFIPALRNHLESPYCAASEEFAEECHDYKDDGVTDPFAVVSIGPMNTDSCLLTSYW